MSADSVPKWLLKQLWLEIYVKDNLEKAPSIHDKSEESRQHIHQVKNNIMTLLLQ